MLIPNQGADLRKGRFSESGQIYLLTSVTDSRRPLFDNWHYGRLMVAEFQKAQYDGYVVTLAWIVMPDHFHWLVSLKSGSLGMLMRRVKGGSSRAIVSAGGGPLKVWQKGYHDRAIRREEDVLKAARYIVANPLRTGLVTNVGDYPFWDAVWL
ncbi:REP-associated tyrosine transposase [Pseudomonas viridiflava]|uniref:REP-associated tyrosine transposase n=1 Tax=Pseudomonas viridiflava TaxID=33069 RepID=UPI000F065595|nr:transposase [Pseudomonas viridiflava]